MPESLTELEQLLEQLGADEVHGDTRHRYALRRALLHSETFESNRSTAYWYQILTVTGSALAGGLVVAVVVVSVTVTRYRTAPASFTAPVAPQVAHVETYTEPQPIAFEETTRHPLPEVRLVDVSEYMTHDRVVQWAPLTQAFATTR